METNLHRPHPLYTHSGVTHRTSATAVAISVVAAGAVAVVAISGGVRRGSLPAPHLILDPARIVADGYDTATLTIESPATSAPAITILGTPHAATIENLTGAPGNWQARIRAGVQPGPIRLRVAFPNAPPAEAQLESLPFTRDTAQDGTPDFLRLDDARGTRPGLPPLVHLPRRGAVLPAARRPPVRDRGRNRGLRRPHPLRLPRSPARPRHRNLGRRRARCRPRSAVRIRGAQISVSLHAPGGRAVSACARAQFPARRPRPPAPSPNLPTRANAPPLSTPICVSRELCRAPCRATCSSFRQPSGDGCPIHSMIYLGESPIRQRRPRATCSTTPAPPAPIPVRNPPARSRPELLRFPRPAMAAHRPPTPAFWGCLAGTS
jgi:hypothetical protein